jgi:parallel beta-helix repeat protein
MDWSSYLKPFRLLFIFVIIFHAILFLAQVGLAATYYVSPNGSDSNPGTEPAPWKTLSKAAQTLVAGDTVFIKNGTYIEQVIPKQSGLAGKEITYAAFPGHTPVLDGQNLSLANRDWGGLFWVRATSYINVIGLRIRGSSLICGNPGIAGILVTDSSNITLENNKISDTCSSGIGVWHSTYVRIIANDIQTAVSGGTQECLTVADSNDFEVARNRVHNGNGFEGIDVKGGSGFGSVHDNRVYDLPGGVGIYVDAYDSKAPGAHDIEIYNNRVHNVGTGIALGAEQGGDLQNVRVFNNIVHHTETYGVIVTDWEPQTEGTKQNITIFNNTIVANGKSYGGGLVIASSRIENVLVFNNLLANNLMWQLAVNTESQPQINATNNLLYGENSYASGHILAITGDSAIMNKDPMFISDTDYHLKGNSPAIDMGITEGAPVVDFDHVDRPQGSGYDIGAYEYVDPGASEIMLLGPNGAEVLSPGSIYDIIWSSSSQAVKFDILYSTDNGVSWIPIAKGVKDRGYAWRVPNPVISKSKCFVKVIGYDQAGLKIGADRSDAPFSIEVVRLTAPSGPGVSVKSGETYDIIWTTSMTGPAVQKVLLYYTKNAEAVPIKWNRIAAFKPDDYPGIYSWVVPSLPQTKTKCKVKVVLKAAGGNRVGVNVSDNLFTIESP